MVVTLLFLQSKNSFLVLVAGFHVYLIVAVEKQTNTDNCTSTNVSFDKFPLIFQCSYRNDVYSMT